MPYAILRTAKIKHLGKLAVSAAHNFRERVVRNADPTRTPQNHTTGAQNSREVLACVKERLASVPKARKNAVLAVEYFIGMSPEFVREGGNVQGYLEAATQWLIARHGRENVLAVTQQFDETTPHLCAYVVPIDPKGRLSASHFLNGRKKLTEMQTEFADQVGKPFGLARGIQGSSATHQTVRQWYAQIQQPQPEQAPSPPTRRGIMPRGAPLAPQNRGYP